MSYLSAIIYTSMIPNIQNFSNKIKGSSLSLPAHGRVGARATLLFLAALFAKRKTKFGGGKARAGREGKGVWGKGIPAPPERNFSKIGVRIFFEKSSDFVQDRQQSLTIRTRNFETRGFARPAPPLAGLVSLERRLRRRVRPN